MKLVDQHRHCEWFFSSCMGIFLHRGVEYAPEDVPLWDVFLNAVKENVNVLTVLRILTDKHITAIRHLELTGRVVGPNIQERFRDIANFQALQSFYVTYQAELHDTWRNHLVQSYRCVCADAQRNPRAFECKLCPSLRWLDAHRPSSEVSRPPSAPLA